MKPSKSSLASPSTSCLSYLSSTRSSIRAYSRKATASSLSKSKNGFKSAFAKPIVVKPQNWPLAMDRKDPITKAAHQLEKALEANDAVFALRICTALKRTGSKPTAQIYRLLMEVFAKKDMYLEIVAAFDDALSMGVEPDKEMWNCLLQARAHSFFTLSETTNKILNAGHELNVGSYRNIMQHHADSRNLIMCLRTLQEMRDKEISPDIPTVEALVILACRQHLPRIAHGLALDYEDKSTRRLNVSTWTQILAASAHCYYTRGVMDGWDRLKDEKITPDEGLCTMVINAAGAAQQPNLIWDAINVLKMVDVPLQEHHIAPLMSSYTLKEQIPQALDLFEFMEDHHIQPTKFTVRGLRKLLATHEDIEIAVAHLRGRVVESGRNLSGAFNSILVATLKDRSNYTVSLGKDMDDLKVTPTIDTFNILIHSATVRRNVPAAHAYYEEILQRGLEPNKETYERIIVLLTSETVYDDAFLYLHKMMTAQLVPSAEVFTGLAKKCALRFDARWKTLVKQMEKYGYLVSDELMKYLVTNGRRSMDVDSPALAIEVDDIASQESGSVEENAEEEVDPLDSALTPLNGPQTTFL